MNRYFLLFLLSVLFLSCSTKKNTEGPNINYLEQGTPGSIPQIFGKDIVSVKGRFDMGFAISPDGNSMAFGVAHESNQEETCIYLMNYINEKWTSPDKSFLKNNVNTFFPMFAPSGKELYFVKSVDESETDLWVASYLDNRLANPHPLDSIFNSDSREAGHGKSKSGSIYFTSNRDDQNQCCGDIYYSRLEPNGYTSVQKVEILNSNADEESLFLSPNEDFIIVQAWKQEYDSKHDLYISYRNKEGTWTIPKRLNSEINGQEIEQRPFVSPDNKFLFFSRMSITHENNQDVYESDIYWVSTKSVFSPYVYNTRIETLVSYKEEFELNLPSDIFKDIDDENLSFKLSLKDGSEIPEWINFDSDKLILSGKWDTKETLSLKLTATDISENSANFEFELKEKTTNKRLL